MPAFRGSEGPRPHSTAAGVRGGRSVFSSVNTAWTCCSNQPIRLFISTCCSSAAAPPALTRGRYGTGGAGGLPDFHRFTRYRRLPQQVATHRAAHLPLQHQRYGIPRLLAQLAELPAQGQQSAGQRIALRMPLRADAEQHRQLRPPFRPLAQYLGARPAAAPPSFPRGSSSPV